MSIQIYRRHSSRCNQKYRRYRRCNCPCWIEGTLEGKYFRKSLKTRSWEHAQKLVREMEEFSISPERATLEHACDAFIQDAESGGLRESSLYKYRLLFRRLQDFASAKGIRFLNEIDLEALRRVRAAWTHKNFAARNKTENLWALFRFAYDAGWLKENPGRKLKNPKITEPPTQPFTRHEGRVGNFQGMLKSIFKSAGVPNGHAHRFRDTFAVELLLAGIPIEQVAVLLGHSSVKTTIRHSSPWVAARQEQLEQAVRSTWTRAKTTSSQIRHWRSAITMGIGCGWGGWIRSVSHGSQHVS